MATAHNLAEAKKALADLQFMAQNIMIGTVDGDIYYVRNGRVPVRPSGCDSSSPCPARRATANGRGIHPFDDLVQITNPPQGYMQNCNVSPFAMMKDSPLVPEKWSAHPYLYNDRRRAPHQRAAMMVDLLDAAHDVTPEQMIGIAFNPQVWHADLWQQRIRKAAPRDDLSPACSPAGTAAPTPIPAPPWPTTIQDWRSARRPRARSTRPPASRTMPSARRWRRPSSV